MMSRRLHLLMFLGWSLFVVSLAGFHGKKQSEVEVKAAFTAAQPATEISPKAPSRTLSQR